MNNKEIAKVFELTLGNVKKRITDLKLIGHRVSNNRTVPVHYNNIQIMQIVGKGLSFTKSDITKPNLKFALIEYYLNSSQQSVEYYAEVFNMSINDVMNIVNDYIVNESIIVESKANFIEL